MRGHIRRRGKTSFEYIVDIGSASVQRCQGCARRFWVERKPREACPKCGDQLVETEERRRAIKGGYATRKECQAALQGAERRRGTYLRAAHQDHGEGVPARRVVAGRQECAAPDDLRQLHDARQGAHHPCHDAVRWGRLTVNPVDAADPPKASAEHSERLPVWTAEQLSAFPASVADERLFALWRLLAMTGMRRGEALGLAWEDLDMEAGRLTIRRAWVPVNGAGR
jgi:integrase